MRIRVQLINGVQSMDAVRGPWLLAALFALAAGGCAAVTLQAPSEPPPAPLPVVRILAPDLPVHEAQDAVIQIHRTTTQGDLQVRIRAWGSATAGIDWVVSGTEAVENENPAAMIHDGQSFALLTIEIVDDVHAEPDETILFQLESVAGYEVHATAEVQIPKNDFVVTNTKDAGEGSLRQAILNANSLPGPDTIRFDSEVGPFRTPQTIVLASELPDLSSEITLDGRIPGRLWVPHGVTISGNGRFRVFLVTAEARVTLSAVTIADGQARVGGGILNRGHLVLRDATLMGNAADTMGGGISNAGSTLAAINSTFARNSAGKSGGGLANDGGWATVTNCTFSQNGAPNGGALFSSGTLLLRNTILANSTVGADCVAKGPVDPASTHNLIESNERCGEPITSADPLFGPLGGYNGPTVTFPLQAGSPAINRGDNASALDENGVPLQWDQRGNGDPRVVGSFTELGSFEYQSFPDLTVDTTEDLDLRGCTRAGGEDCSLRGAIHLANATAEPDTIRFDERVFGSPQTLQLTRPLPSLTTDMTIDASTTGGVTVIGRLAPPLFQVAPGATVKLIGLEVRDAPADVPSTGSSR